jgi:hypothetical protein
MRLPRDLSGRDLLKALERDGYGVTRQTGSHLRLTTAPARGTPYQCSGGRMVPHELSTGSAALPRETLARPRGLIGSASSALHTTAQCQHG